MRISRGLVVGRTLGVLRRWRREGRGGEGWRREGRAADAAAEERRRPGDAAATRVVRVGVSDDGVAGVADDGVPRVAHVAAGVVVVPLRGLHAGQRHQRRVRLAVARRVGRVITRLARGSRTAG